MKQNEFTISLKIVNHFFLSSNHSLDEDNSAGLLQGFNKKNTRQEELSFEFLLFTNIVTNYFFFDTPTVRPRRPVVFVC